MGSLVKMNGNNPSISHACDMTVHSIQEAYHSTYSPSTFVNGWMYVNENGQMCGPYIQEQLCEGLSSGFLPDELLVYPLRNGNFASPIPLKYFKQFPDHVATGFMHLSAGFQSSTSSDNYFSNPIEFVPTRSDDPSKSTISVMQQASYEYQKRHYSSDFCSSVENNNYHSSEQLRETEILNLDAVLPLMSHERSCWMFDDGGGKVCGPYSISDLYSWHQYGYLDGSLLIYDSDHKLGNFPLYYIINAFVKSKCESLCPFVVENCDDISSFKFISRLSDAVSCELRTVIMEAAGRAILDDIINFVISQSEMVTTTLRDANSAITQCFDSGMCDEGMKDKNHGNEVYLPHNSNDSKDLNMSVYKVLYDFCMQVIWNAIFYDPIAEYTREWRKEKRRFNGPVKMGFSFNERPDFETSPEKITNPEGEQDERTTGCDIAGPIELHMKSSSPKLIEKVSCHSPISHLNLNFDIDVILQLVVNELYDTARQSLVEDAKNVIHHEVNDVLNHLNKEIICKEVDSSSVDTCVVKSGPDMLTPSVASDTTASEIINFSDSKSQLSQVLDVKSTSVDSVFGTAKKNAFARTFLRLSKSCDASQLFGDVNIISSGFEYSENTAAQSHLGKFKSSSSVFSFSSIDKYVAIAMYRMKLHDGVLNEWKLFCIDGIMSKFYESRPCINSDSEQVPVPRTNDVNLKSSAAEDNCKESIMNNSTGPSNLRMVLGGYTHQRKKKSFRKKLGSFFFTPDHIDFEDRPLEKLNISRGVYNKMMSNEDQHDITNLSGIQRFHNELSAVDNSCQQLGIQNSVSDESGDPLSMIGSEEISTLPSFEINNKSPDFRIKDFKGIQSSLNIGKDLKTTDDHAMELPSCSQIALNIKSRKSVPHPSSDGCARASVDGWKWRSWSLKASRSMKALSRGEHLFQTHYFGSDITTSRSSLVKGLSARTNRVKVRTLLAAADGAEILKATQLKARKKLLRFQRSKIHDWGIITLESIDAEDFVIEYVGELIRPRVSDIRESLYEKMGIGNSYLFRLDDGYVVDATKRGGIARFINHSCDPNCYTKVISVEGDKRIFIYARRHISTGEEITYNYKFPLEEKKIPCNCGSWKCRGSLN